MLRYAALVAGLLLAGAAQAAPLTYSLTVDGTKLSGSGASVLREAMSGAQFILYGEDHGFADSPIVLRAIAHEAKPLGFNYHVVEVGPITTRLVADTLAEEGIAGVHKLVHAAPLGVPFLSLKGDAELASDFTGVDAKGTPYLWGIDQEFIGSPVIHLKRLVAIAPNNAARSAAQALLDSETAAAAKADQQNFLLVHGSDADFDALAAKFAGNAEALNIIAEMKESATVYQLWMHDHNYENNARRARLLAKNFLADYQAAADLEPKVVFKMGLEHVGLGTSPNNTIDIGTLTTEMARAHGKTALRIGFLPMGGHKLSFAPKPGNPTALEAYDEPDVKDFFASIGVSATDLSKNGWTLIPLEPIRQSLDTKGIEKLKPFARFTLLGYDYIVTTADAKAGVSLY